MEYYTSLIGITHNIPVIQYSSYALKYAVKHKCDLNSNLSILPDVSKIEQDRMKMLIENSSKTFINSHLGDAGLKLQLKDNVCWCRPYYTTGMSYVKSDCSEIAAGNITNIEYIQYLRKTKTAILFTDANINFSNITIKDLYSNEYSQYLNDCKYYISEGTPILLADSYYNNKFNLVLTDKYNLNDLTTAFIAQKYNHCQILFRLNNSIKEDTSFNVNIRDDIKSIDEELENLEF
jgi:hypothetical protein